MTRDELIQIGADALAADRYSDVPANPWHKNIAAVVIAAVEPVIRADQREKTNVYWRGEAARWRQARDFPPEDARAELQWLHLEVDRLMGENARLIGMQVYGKKAQEEQLLIDEGSA